MLARSLQRQTVRQFSASTKQLSGHFPEVPYAVPHLIFWILGAGIPFFAVTVQQVRAGVWSL
ncbi:hypothetical protein C6P40_004254 [Pichia californica]|uniref:Uncharacterized protein n=1 Tax=Pichia californica TaxID=460514 RepID=A0A9P6WMZ4_9ASCO|nr:hypothetical protein C6P40_004254 [[Candida] californica]